VADPATGLRRIPRAEFEQKWSGYAALFDYTTAFEKAPEGKNALAWLYRSLPASHSFAASVRSRGVASALQLLFPVLTQVVVDKVIVEQDVGLLKVTLLALVTAGFSCWAPVCCNNTY